MGLCCFVKKAACFLQKKDFILCFSVINQSKFLFRKKSRNRKQQKKILRRLSSKLLKNGKNDTISSTFLFLKPLSINQIEQFDSVYSREMEIKIPLFFYVPKVTQLNKLFYTTLKISKLCIS